MFTIIFLILVTIFFFVFTIYMIGCVIGDFMGAPFVPTSSKMTDEILKHAQLQKNQLFIELGSGDGRITRKAVRQYRVQGLGIEIHPFLIWYSRIISHVQHLKKITFQTGNLFSVDLSKADAVFVFLLPKSVKKLSKKLQRECRTNTLIISHGFQIPGFEKQLESKIQRPLFPTYYYRVK